MVYTWASGALDALKGIEPHEVVQALAARRRLPVPGTAHGIPVLAAFGRTRAGRLLMVLVHVDALFAQQIVAVREATAEESAAFERWRGEHD